MTIILALVAVLAAFGIGYLVGRGRGVAPEPPAATARTEPAPASPEPLPAPRLPATPPRMADNLNDERARIIRSYEMEIARLQRQAVPSEGITDELAATQAERARLADELAAARGETARYRQLVVDLENNAPPPFFGAGAPDDLKLIVGIGPVLERMLHQLGVTTFRQIARWSERDINEFDAKLPEFPGRIRRDAWVTQARALHQSKYGETLPQRGL